MARLGRAQPFKPLVRSTFRASADVTVALTGVAAACAVGAVGVALSVALTGAAATGSVGAVVPSASVGLTGVSSAAAVGNVTAPGNVTVALTGVSATSAAGTLAPSSTLPLTGAAASGSPGSFSPASQRALSGVAAAGAVGTLAASTPPANISAATATELGPLPNAISQRVDAGGTTYVVWYKYTPPADQTIGIWAFGDLAVYTPQVEMFQADGVTPYRSGVGGSAALNKRLQIPVASGAVVYFKISENPLGHNPSPANLTISALVAPHDAIVPGDILVNDDDDGMPGCVLTPAGAIRQFVLGMANGEGGAMLPSGQFVLSCDDQDVNAGNVNIYNADCSFRAAITVGGFANAIVGASDTYFYAVDDSASNVVQQFDIDGTVLRNWTFADLFAIAPSRDDAILYYVPSFPGTVIQRWDLVNNVALTDLYSYAANTNFVRELLVLSDGTIIVGLHNTSTGAYQVLHLSAAGSVLHTFTVTASGILNRLALNVGDTALSFWAWSLPTTQNVSVYQEIQIADGSVLQTTGEVIQYETGVYALDATATPAAEFGPSFSCPFLILRAAPAVVCACCQTPLGCWTDGAPGSIKAGYWGAAFTRTDLKVGTV